MNKNTKKIASIVLVTSSITNVSTLGVFAEEFTNNNTTKIENISTKALQENDIVNIPDENLKRELNYALSQKVDSNITVRQLSSLKKLQLSNKQIKNLEGLQYCTNLTDLQIFNNQIKDISPLSSLGNLTNLSMFNNQISDISVLSELINLTDLNFGGNQISDVSALSELTSLKSLSLSGNKISNIRNLSKLANLTNLDLDRNQISDISALSGLINLERLNLNENNLTNTNGLDKLINLKNLSLCENQINDISSLSKLTNLESLGLHTNQISDISALSNLTNLNSLTLFTNQVSDISPLKNLKKLYHINARHQSIVLPAVVSQAGENISVKNEGIGMDGEPIVPDRISNGGILNKSTNYITWKSANISNVDSVSYDFAYYDKENVQIFAGKVTQPIESVSEFKIKNPISGMYVGNNHKLIASLNGKDVDNVTWSVDNEDIATISKDGTLNAKKPGNVMVTVKLNNSSISYSTNIELVNFYDNTNIPSIVKDVIDTNVFTPIYSDANGTQNNPVTFNLKNSATISDVDKFINNISKLSPNILESKVEGNYTTYKIRINSDSKTSNYSYIEIKIDNNMPNASEINQKINKLKEYKSKINELVGINRFDTAVKVSQTGWNTSENAVLVNANSLADALSVTPFAAQKNAPVLLSNSNSLNQATKAEFKRLGVKKVYAIGGTTAISEDIVNELKSMGVTVERISGKDRYETSLAIANKLNNVNKIAVVNGENGFADAVSIAPVCARDNMAIVYTSPRSGLKTFENYIKNNNIATSYVIGGTTVLPDNLITELKNPVRIAGSNRNLTNLNIIERFFSNTNHNNQTELKNIFVAKNGYGSPNDLIDALSVGVLASKQNSPVMLVSPNGLDKNQSTALYYTFSKQLTKVGGNGNETAFEQLKNQVNHIK